MTCKRNVFENTNINQRIFTFTAMFYKQSQSNNTNCKCSNLYSRTFSERCHISKTIYQSQEGQHDKDNSPDINWYFLRFMFFLNRADSQNQCQNALFVSYLHKYRFLLRKIILTILLNPRKRHFSQDFLIAYWYFLPDLCFILPLYFCQSPSLLWLI